MNLAQTLTALVFLLVATTLETTGDAVVRIALHNPAAPLRPILMLTGAALLLGYGCCLNLAPVEFGRVVGLYIATLFVVWQVVSYVSFRTVPTLPVLVGGALIVAGGLIVTFWQRPPTP